MKDKITTHQGIDYALFVTTLMLMAVGVMMVYSSSAIFAKENFSDSLYFLKKEAIFTSLGVVSILVFRKIDYHIYYKLVYPILIFTLFLLILVFLPGIGHSVKGAQRWIRIAGFSLQPSEFTKIALLIFLAYSLSKKGTSIKSFSKGLLPVLGISGLFLGLVLLQKDLGTPMILVALIFTMLFIGGARFLHLFSMFAVCVPALAALIYFFPHRVKRLICFWDPFQEPYGCGFQLIQSYVAFQGGGLTGRGLGQGKQKLFYLPESHTDFIFPNLAEELGLIGSLLVIFFFIVLLVRGIKISVRAPDSFGTYLAVGITLLISLQAAFNLAVVMGMIPTKGLPLPFISHGGTYLLVVTALIGVLLNISSQSVKAD
ncbi:MAG: putative lipid II flippase FtsW [Deltaproteobacteria bacterium]|nr:putative lipid II flippase FtsW [Deltaproteobacteria bacterium]